MNDQSPVLRVVSLGAVPATGLVSTVIFLQGHDLPGGGFIAGVMGAAAGAMFAMAFGIAALDRIPWWRVSVVGLLVAFLTGAIPMFFGRVFLDHAQLDGHLPVIGHVHLPTATFFDIGVYLIVVGTLLTIFVELGKESG